MNIVISSTDILLVPYFITTLYNILENWSIIQFEKYQSVFYILLQYFTRLPLSLKSEVKLIFDD